MMRRYCELQRGVVPWSYGYVLGLIYGIPTWYGCHFGLCSVLWAILWDYVVGFLKACTISIHDSIVYFGYEKHLGVTYAAGSEMASQEP